MVPALKGGGVKQIICYLKQHNSGKHAYYDVKVGVNRI